MTHEVNDIDIFAARLDNTVFDVSLDGIVDPGVGRFSVSAALRDQIAQFVDDIANSEVNVRTWLEYLNGVTNGIFPALTTEQNSTTTRLDFARPYFLEFLISYGISDDVSVDTPLSDEWEALYQEFGGGASRQEWVENLFYRTFDHFIRDYQDETIDFATQGADGVLRQFHASWGDFLSQINLLAGSGFSANDPSSFFNLGGNQVAPFSSANLTSYRDLYFAFVPDATQTDFEAALVQFFEDNVDDEGYFNPNQLTGAWFEVVQNTSLVRIFGTTAVDGTGSEQVRIIFEVFRLLVDMIGVLQRIAATQARRLTFYANIQQAYTRLIGEIPNLDPADIQNLSVSINRDRRNAVLQSVQTTNQAFTEELRSFRSIWSDEARSHQTTVNQSNETVNQQANLATALLQQMSTILSGIFR